ncbi:hypothetical protein [Candidatus Cytomitobacter primus]|uniref:Uncharacterized protein n=1 Tax=Candidatus Cytomitobacter primus TaxID=2066024 RepID=A0A5C0UGK0_9PROT|nr:hypothetical protein [Candidatus Cytomitobacter primus]QEK38683.1 hypothetical protein FZC34_02055 [Candidatus Cytomitobacter primus]
MSFITCVLHGGDSENKSYSHPFEGKYVSVGTDGTVKITAPEFSQPEKVEVYYENPAEWEWLFLDKDRDAYYYVRKDEHSNNDTRDSEITKHIKGQKTFTKNDLDDAAKQADINTAKKMLIKNIMSIGDISEVTTLTIDEVSKLKNEIDGKQLSDAKRRRIS